MAMATASAKGLRVIGHHDLNGYGDGMQVLREGNALYVGHNGPSGMGTSILDVSDPTNPRLVEQWPSPPNTHTHKVQVADGLLLVNNERFPYRPKTPLGPHSAGLVVYSLADPLHPERIGFWESGGKGVHRIVWEGGRYAHLSATPDGFRDRIWVVIDMADPTNPRLASKWWMPGQWEAGGETVPTRNHPDGHFRAAAHHALTEGDYAYLGYDDANLVVLDVSDMTDPKQVGSCFWGGGATHTAMPLAGRDLLVVSDEQQFDGPHAPERRIHLIDIADPRNPRYLRQVPAPDAAYDSQPQRFGPHGFHENRAGSYRSNRLVFAAYFNAGVRVYDLADPEDPREIAHWVSETPPGSAAPQANDLFVDSDGIVWVTDRGTGGVFALQPDDELAALMAESAY
jgi:hypothetical protein